MPTLNPLAPEMKTALGTSLEAQYDLLVQKSKEESLRDNPAAVKYVDSVIRRYMAIHGTSASDSRREPYLAQLKKHAGELSVLSFSKTSDVASRLQKVDFSNDLINDLTKGIEQAGSNDDEITTLITSLVTSETSLLMSGDGHHHGHPSRW